MTPPRHPSRRQLCLGCGAALLYAACEVEQDAPDAGLPADLALPRDLARRPADLSGPFNAGPALAVPLGGAVLFEDEIYLCRDAAGLYALSARCTHRRCTIDFVSLARVFSCPCHGSQYAFDGTLRSGPAMRSLPHLLVSIDAAGDALIDPSQEVPPTTRI